MSEIPAVTWNVEKGGHQPTVRRILREHLAAGVVLFFLQEVTGSTIATFKAAGLQIHPHPIASNAVAWVPRVFELRSVRNVDLADTYLDTTRKPPKRIRTASPVVLLHHRPSGRTVEALSFHTPSRVDRLRPEKIRVAVLKGAVANMSRLARTTSADHFIAGGDINVHLTKSKRWDFMRRLATKMALIQPPTGTHGRRRIDVFYVRNTWIIGGGQTGAGGGDHRWHRQRFSLVRPRPKAAPTPKPQPQPKPAGPRSQNGWPALAKDSSKLHTWVVPARGGTVRIRMRNGSVGFILAWVVLRWAELFETVAGKVLDDWGWAWRPVRGQTSGLSNHASGTAVDINATRWPLGTRHMTAWQRARVVYVLGLARVLLTWGGVWKRPDQMHVELKAGASMAACERLAKTLLKTPRGKRLIAANPSQKAVIYS